MCFSMCMFPAVSDFCCIRPPSGPPGMFSNGCNVIVLHLSNDNSDFGHLVLTDVHTCMQVRRKSLTGLKCVCDFSNRLLESILTCIHRHFTALIVLFLWSCYLYVNICCRIASFVSASLCFTNCGRFLQSDTDIAVPPHTRLLCTLGPASCEVDTLVELMLIGMKVRSCVLSQNMTCNRYNIPEIDNEHVDSIILLNTNQCTSGLNPFYTAVEIYHEDVEKEHHARAVSSFCMENPCKSELAVSTVRY